MRRIATLPHDQAEKLADYLLLQGIQTRLDPDPQASNPPLTDLWVCDENRLSEARRELEQFQREPDAPRYLQARSQAAARRYAEDRAEEAYRRQTTALRQQMLQLGTLPPLFFTWTLLSACVFLFAWMLGDEYRREHLIRLLIIESDRPRPRADLPDSPELPPYRPIVPLKQEPALDEGAHGLEPLDGHLAPRRLVWVPLSYLHDVRQGQVWRLVTPILLHFSPTHLLFNMLALVYWGSVLESRYGTGRFLLMVLGLAVVTNLAQYFLGRGLVWENGHLLCITSTQFGGMSGVIYGLFGFLWYKTRYRPQSDLRLPTAVIVIGLAWFVLCWTGALGPIANVAHTAGLAVGWLLGRLPD